MKFAGVFKILLLPFRIRLRFILHNISHQQIRINVTADYTEVFSIGNVQTENIYLMH